MIAEFMTLWINLGGRPDKNKKKQIVSLQLKFFYPYKSQ
jgi:hypothetical protein